MSSRRCHKCSKIIVPDYLACSVCLKFFHRGYCATYLKYKTASECCKIEFFDLLVSISSISSTMSNSTISSKLTGGSQDHFQLILDKLDSLEARLVNFIKDQSDINLPIAEKIGCLPSILKKVDKHHEFLRKLTDQNITLKQEIDLLKSSYSTPLLTSSSSSELFLSGIPDEFVSYVHHATSKVLSSLGVDYLLPDVLGVRLMSRKPQSSADSLQTRQTALVASGSSTNSLVVSLKSVQVKDFIISRKREKRNLPISDVFDIRHSGNIFINELLPADKYNLLRRTKIKAKANGFKYVWVRSGRIVVRHGDGSEVINVNSVTDLVRLV
ncbi:hypothetical protein M0802_013244 [Mischocyttarus mexicanus]|nr:hypothetical protein M0802_013244 [Mischocyttarus mexicanus]